MLRGRLRAAAGAARAQPAVGPARAAAHDLRARDRDPEPAAQSFSPDVRSLGAAPGRLATASWQITEPALDLGARRAHPRRRDRGPRRPAALPLADAAGPADARDGAGPRHRRARRHQLARGVRARHRDRRRDRGARRRVPRDPLDLRPVHRADAADLRLRGGRDRRPRLRCGGRSRAAIVLGVAQTIGAQINPEYSVLAGHIVFLAVLASPRGGLLASARAAAHERARPIRVDSMTVAAAGRALSAGFTRGFGGCSSSRSSSSRSLLERERRRRS